MMKKSLYEWSSWHRCPEVIFSFFAQRFDVLRIFP